MHHNKSFKMRVPKKHPKNLSKNQFSDAFWHPKTLQNRGKIVSKTTSKKEWKNKAEKNPPRPSKKICLSKEREARTLLNVVEACNCKVPKVPTRGNKTSSSRSKQSSSSKRRKAPDSSRAMHAQWVMETQRKHQRASLARPTC